MAASCTIPSSRHNRTGICVILWLMIEGHRAWQGSSGTRRFPQRAATTSFLDRVSCPESVMQLPRAECEYAWNKHPRVRSSRKSTSRETAHQANFQTAGADSGLSVSSTNSAKARAFALASLAASTRSVLHIMERIGNAGAGFRSITENIDTTTPTGRMIMQMVGAFAEFEREMIRERTTAGLAAARAAGRIGGRRKKLDAAKRREIAESVISGRKSGADMARLYSVIISLPAAAP